MKSPHRIWINFAKANQYFLAYDEPPREGDDCEDEYVRADLAAPSLAAALNHPQVQQLIEALGEIAWSNDSQWQADRAHDAIRALGDAQ